MEGHLQIFQKYHKSYFCSLIYLILDFVLFFAKDDGNGQSYPFEYMLWEVGGSIKIISYVF